MKRLLLQREFGLIMLILLTGGIVSVVDPGFLQAANLLDILVRAAPTAIVTCGVMLVVVTGEIDISVGSLMAVMAAVLGVLLSSDHLAVSMWLGILATLLAGTIIGAVTGALVTIGRVPSIVVTLGMLTGLRGATTLLMGGDNIYGLPDSLTAAAKVGFLGIPLSIWVAVFVISVTAVLIRQTALGLRLYAVGSSQHSAEMIGLSETKLKLFAFTFTGFLTSVATVVDIPRLPRIESGVGNGFELLVVTCVVVGGVSINGGRGRLAGVLLAVVLMTMIRPVLTFLDVGEAAEKWTRAVQGVFILLAIVVDTLASRGKGAGQ